MTDTIESLRQQLQAEQDKIERLHEQLQHALNSYENIHSQATQLRQQLAECQAREAKRITELRLINRRAKGLCNGSTPIQNAPYHIWQSAEAALSIPNDATALNELIAAVEANCVPQWQPIETAPKDVRTMFVVVGIGVRNGTYTTDPCCVWRTIEGRFERWKHQFEPTHWMPLPSAPAQKEES